MSPPSIFLLPILLESVLLTPFALTVPASDSLVQINHTAAPLAIINTHNLHPAYTPLLPPVCYFLTDPPMTALSSSKCALLAGDVCADLESRGPEARGRWIWEEISGCALGYFLPDGAEVPRKGECEYQIFDQIRRECAGGSQYNAGAMNVFELPDFSGDGSGMVEEWGRYLMAPERLTL